MSDTFKAASTATKYLRERNIIAGDMFDLIIKFTTGKTESLVDLLDDYCEYKQSMIHKRNNPNLPTFKNPPPPPPIKWTNIKQEGGDGYA